MTTTTTADPGVLARLLLACGVPPDETLAVAAGPAYGSVQSWELPYDAGWVVHVTRAGKPYTYAIEASYPEALCGYLIPNGLTPDETTLNIANVIGLDAINPASPTSQGRFRSS